MPSIAMTQFFGDFNSREQIDAHHTDDGILSVWNIYDFPVYDWAECSLCSFPFSSFSLWTPTQTVTGGLSSKTMTCCYRLIRTVGEWTKSHQLFMAVTTCILNLDKQTNSSNLCLQIVDLKLYGINVPGILQT